MLRWGMWILFSALILVSAMLHRWQWRRDDDLPHPDWMLAGFETLMAVVRGAFLFGLCGPPIGWLGWCLVSAVFLRDDVARDGWLLGSLFSWFIGLIPASVTGAILMPLRHWIRRFSHCVASAAVGVSVTALYLSTGKAAGLDSDQRLFAMATALPATIVCAWLFARSPARTSAAQPASSA